MCFLAIANIDSRADGTDDNECVRWRSAQYDRDGDSLFASIPFNCWLCDTVDLESRLHNGPNTEVVASRYCEENLPLFLLNTSDEEEYFPLDAVRDHAIVEINTKQDSLQCFRRLSTFRDIIFMSRSNTKRTMSC